MLFTVPAVGMAAAAGGGGGAAAAGGGLGAGLGLGLFGGDKKKKKEKPPAPPYTGPKMFGGPHSTALPQVQGFFDPAFMDILKGVKTAPFMRPENM